jgi:sulfur carrier protein
MIITVNGEEQTWEESAVNIADLLAANKVDKPDMVSVQLNGAFVDKKDYGTKKVVANDEVDFLYFLGGGKAQ